MSFDPYNHPLKIWKSIGTLVPKVEAHLVLWTDYKQMENYKTRQALLIHQPVLIC
jgi:hypothetical protein